MVHKIIGISVTHSRVSHRQKCYFILEDGRRFSMVNDRIYELTTVKPNELEVFIGSQLKISNDDTSQKIEEFLLTASHLTSYRNSEKNRTGFEEIEDIAAYETQYGSFMFQLKTPSNVFEINYKPLSIMTGIVEPLFLSLIGCYINPTFFRKGEMMGEIECLKDNKTIKDLNLRYSYKFPEKIGMLRMNGDFQEPKNVKFVIPDLNKNKGERQNSDYSGGSKQSQYGGPRDGYGGSLDDDFINDVLDGDPEAYWNID